MPTRYVNCAASPGGDGTTNATVGANRAYGSLSEAEAALPADITTGGNQGIWTIQCEGSTADTTGVTFSGTTTSATYYVKVQAGPSDRATMPWSTSRYRLTTAAASSIVLTYDYVRIFGIQISCDYEINGAYGIDLSSRDGIVIAYNVIRTTVAVDRSVYGIRGSNSGGTNQIYNNVIYDFSQASMLGASVSASFTQTIAVFNNTFHNCRVGLDSGGWSDRIKAINNLFRSCTAACAGTFAAGTDYNVTDLASLGYTVTGGGNSHDHTSHTFTFVNEAGDDFHLASTDVGAINLGVSDPGSGLFSDDFDGVARCAVWDIGADEYAKVVNDLSLRWSAPSVVVNDLTLGWEPAGGTSTQELTVPALAGTSFDEVTVTPQPVTVTVTYLDTAVQFYSASVSLTVAPPAIEGTTFYAPTVFPQPVTVTVGALESAVQFYSATVAPQAVTLTGPYLTSGELYGPTVAPQAVTLTAPYLTAGELYAPTVAPQAVTLTAPYLTSAVQFYTATLALTLLPPAIPTGETLYAMTVSQPQGSKLLIFSRHYAQMRSA